MDYMRSALLWAYYGNLAVAMLVLSALSIILLVFGYRLFLHPLAKVPGPKLGAVTSVWYAWNARNGRMAELGKHIHNEYGPVVRVRPNEVWFNSKEAHRAIYSKNPHMLDGKGLTLVAGAGSGFEKSDFYLATALSRPHLDSLLRPTSADTLDFLSERDMKRYRLQRRLVGPLYQSSSVSKFAPLVDEVLERFTASVKALDGQQIDLKEWMHILTVECLGAVVLSWSPGMIKQGSDMGTSVHSYQGWRRKSVFGVFPLATKLEMCSKKLGRWFSNIWGVTYHPPEGFRPFFPDVQKRITRRIKVGLRPKPPVDNRQDLMKGLIQLHVDKPQFTANYLRRMAMTNFGAGHETLASTLTSIVALVASHPDVKRQVEDEATQLPSQASIVYIQATIKESKRLRPVLSMALPRVVPPSGLQLCGLYFPPGTVVGCNPVSLHRNTDICGPDPDVFDPRRWLDPEAARRMERYSLAWGGGARTCPGRHLAEMMVDRIVPRLFREFDIDVTIPEENKMPSYFLSMMTGVKARFRTKDGGNI